MIFLTLFLEFYLKISSKTCFNDSKMNWNYMGAFGFLIDTTSRYILLILVSNYIFDKIKEEEEIDKRSFVHFHCQRNQKTLSLLKYNTMKKSQKENFVFYFFYSSSLPCCI